MKFIINDKCINEFKTKYDIDIKKDNLFIPPLFSNIRDTLKLINKKDSFLSLAAIQTDNKPIYVLNTIKKDLLDEAVLKSQKYFFFIIKFAKPIKAISF